MAKPRQQQTATQRSSASRNSRPAVTRALMLLEALAAEERPAALSDLAQTLGLPPATAYRLCQRLEDEGFVSRDGSKRKYKVGARLMRLGFAIMRSTGAHSSRRAILQQLVDRIGETCNLTTLAGNEVMYIDRVETRWPLRLTLEPGSRVPMHCTASGKLLLASLPKPARDQILKTMVFSRETPNTITNRVALDRDLRLIARHNYSTDNEEFLTGLIAIAVPITDNRGKTFAAVACHAPVARLSLKEAVTLVPLLQSAAAKLAQSFES